MTLLAAETKKTLSRFCRKIIKPERVCEVSQVICGASRENKKLFLVYARLKNCSTQSGICLVCRRRLNLWRRRRQKKSITPVHNEFLAHQACDSKVALPTEFYAPTVRPPKKKTLYTMLKTKDFFCTSFVFPRHLSFGNKLTRMVA